MPFESVMKMQVKIQTLTPLWTGGVDGGMDRIHETGIIGSLRWWYEAIVRGLGGKACDPSKHSCNYSAGLCDVCQVFGATGWRKRFQIDVAADRTEPIYPPESRMLNVRPPDRNRGWYLPPGRMGEFVLDITGDRETMSRIAALLLFLEERGSIGAKPQLGYGVFRILNREEIKALATDHQWRPFSAEPADHDRLNPDLRYFGFFKYNFQPERSNWWTWVAGIERIATKVQPFVISHGTAPISPAFKNELRYHHIWQGDREDEKRMFGALQARAWDEERNKPRAVRIRSKVAVSWAYKKDNEWQVRGWIWMQRPQNARDVWNLLQDRNAWQEAISARGSIGADPAGEWRERRPEGVADFLGKIK
jgi:CRISPR-associated protein Cmr1